MNENHRLKYLAINPEDREWGLVVNVVGFQEKEADAKHPVGIHPNHYMFKAQKGRILSDFQLLYLTRGHGIFRCGTLGRNKSIRIKEGDMFLLFPGEWHTYYADPGSPWDEFWIGFEGSIPQEWLAKRLIDPSHPVFNVGVRDKIAAAYNTAIEAALTQKPGYQQILGSLASHLLSLAIYYDKRKEFNSSVDDVAMEKARIFIEQQLPTINPEDLAKKVNMGYSKFRKLFKQYTGFAPAHFITEMKMTRAKELLSSTDKSVKAIAMELGYEDSDYFVAVFKRLEGCRPSSYRVNSKSTS